jgi:hypothetical protein
LALFGDLGASVSGRFEEELTRILPRLLVDIREEKFTTESRRATRLLGVFAERQERQEENSSYVFLGALGVLAHLAQFLFWEE